MPSGRTSSTVAMSTSITRNQRKHRALHGLWRSMGIKLLQAVTQLLQLLRCQAVHRHFSAITCSGSIRIFRHLPFFPCAIHKPTLRRLPWAHAGNRPGLWEYNVWGNSAVRGIFVTTVRCGRFKDEQSNILNLLQNLFMSLLLGALRLPSRAARR